MTNPAPFAIPRSQAECVNNRQPADPIQESICRGHLEKVAGSVTFCRAGQLRNLLMWLGERSLAAHRTAPSEKEIAAGVLNRKDFDPQTDSLVRKEMSRLREKVARYYLSEGLNDSIRVDASSGYLLSFDRNRLAGCPGAGSCWLVLPLRSSTEMAETCEQLLEELLIMLGEHRGFELVSATTALAYRGRTGDIRQFAAECRADFVIEGSLRRRNESIEAMIWLVDGQSGRARRSRRITGVTGSDLAGSISSWMIEDDAPES
jgi:hypothetical protein